jgi:hypothetical protein
MRIHPSKFEMTTRLGLLRILYWLPLYSGWIECRTNNRPGLLETSLSTKVSGSILTPILIEKTRRVDNSPRVYLIQMSLADDSYDDNNGHNFTNSAETTSI